MSDSIEVSGLPTSIKWVPVYDDDATLPPVGMWLQFWMHYGWRVGRRLPPELGKYRRWEIYGEGVVDVNPLYWAYWAPQLEPPNQFTREEGEECNVHDRT